MSAAYISLGAVELQHDTIISVRSHCQACTTALLGRFTVSSKQLNCAELEGGNVQNIKEMIQACQVVNNNLGKWKVSPEMETKPSQ
ncbi:hypothetical protein EV2_045902 [Malus domestica]